MNPYGHLQQVLVLVLLVFLVKGSLSARPELGTGKRSLLTSPTCDAAADYALVLDSSGSLGASGWANLLIAAQKLVLAATNPANKYYANSFSTNLEILMPAGFGTKQVVQTALGGAQWLQGSTNMYAGFNDAFDKFKSSTSTNTVKLCFLISDGEWNTGGDPSPVTQQMKNAGITIVTIGVGAANQAILQGLSSGPGYFFYAADVNALITSIEGWLYRVCPLVCKPPQSFTLVAGSNNKCTLPRCVNGNTQNCFEVYASGATGAVTYNPSGDLVVPAGSDQTFNVQVTSGNQPSCTGTVYIKCQIPPYVQCTADWQCHGKLDPNVTCARVACDTTTKKCVYKPRPNTWPCNDGNPCTGAPWPGSDKCDGYNIGAGACKGIERNCATTSLPPVPALRACYDTPFCEPQNGTCVYPYKADSLNAIISANSYCGTWAGAFSTTLVSNGTTPNPSGSTAYSACYSQCTSSVCAMAAVPSCTCTTTAYSYSVAQAGTCAPCPLELSAQGICATCTSGTYTTSDGSNAKATCWYPDANVKSGAGGYLYPCPGSVYTEYVLTGGTSVSQCMGCMALGSAYNKNSSVCYAGNLSVPVDP